MQSENKRNGYCFRDGFGFGKSERLCHTRLADRVFRQGKSFYAFPLRVIYTLESSDETSGLFKPSRFGEEANAQLRLAKMGIAPLQVMLTVPKRKMRRAVDRVRLRRLMREAWRIARIPLRDLLLDKGLVMNVALIYSGDEMASYSVIEKKMSKVMSRLTEAVETYNAEES